MPDSLLNQKVFRLAIIDDRFQPSCILSALMIALGRWVGSNVIVFLPAVTIAMTTPDNYVIFLNPRFLITFDTLPLVIYTGRPSTGRILSRNLLFKGNFTFSKLASCDFKCCRYNINIKLPTLASIPHSNRRTKNLEY